MAYPVDAPYEARVAGTTTIKKAWGDATDASLNGLFGGTKTVVALTADGVGGQALTPEAGRIRAAAGFEARSLNLGTSGTTAQIMTSFGDAGASANELFGEVIDATIQTTDATVTTVLAYTLPIKTALHVHVRAVAIKSDWTDYASYWSSYFVKSNASGVAVTSGPVAVVADIEADAAWGGVTFAVSGGVLSVKVTGKAATTIKWMLRIDFVLAYG